MKKSFKLVLILAAMVFLYNPSLLSANIFDDDCNIQHISNAQTGASLFSNWTFIFDEENGDEGRAIAIDSDNNVYVAGKIYNTSKSSNDVVLIKYNEYGNQLWNTTWGGNNDDYARGIITNGTTDIYIIGATQSYGNGSYDACILRFNKIGQLIWNITWGGVEWDEGCDIAIDISDDILVTGYSESFEPNGDVFLARFNTSGALKWNTTWGGDDNDFGNGLVVDSLGNIFVTGHTSSYGLPGTNLLLLKFNSSGDLKFNSTWGGNLIDVGTDIMTDTANNVYLIGNTESFGASDYSITLMKYNNSGFLLWNASWDGFNYDYGHSFVLDSNNNSYIIGITKSLGDTDGDACLIQFNSTGSLVWEKTWGGANEDTGYGVGIDGNNNIYVTGQTKSYGDVSGDIFLTQYYHLSIPGAFQLIHNASVNDNDGNFTLNWSLSERADNYSVYTHDTFIYDINNNGTLIASNITSNAYNITNLTSGIYYYVILAHNKAGENISNCVSISVGRWPVPFNLSVNADNPDPDGRFELVWTVSNFTDNYSIYYHTSYISEFNDSLTFYKTLAPGAIPEDGDFNLIENWDDGIYYLVVVARNLYENISSNCVKLVINKPTSERQPEDNNDSSPENNSIDLMPLILFLLLILMLGITGIIQRKRNNPFSR